MTSKSRMVIDVTIEDIKTSDKVMLTPADIAEALGVDAQGIRVMAHEQPERLGFQVVICGRNGRAVRIPRLAFLKFLGVD